MDLFRHQSTSKKDYTPLLRRALVATLALSTLVPALYLCLLRGFVIQAPEGAYFSPPLSLSDSIPSSAAATPVFLSNTDETAREPPTPTEAHLLPAPWHQADLQRAAEEAGQTALLFPLRDQSGKLAYASSVPLAIASTASASDPTQNEALKTLCEDTDAYTIALLSCFADETLLSLHPDYYLSRPGGAPYVDEAGTAWLDPQNPAVLTYLESLVLEVASLGFDEIVLEAAHYPPASSADAYRRPKNPNDALIAFYDSLRTALSKQDVRFSLSYEDSSNGIGTHEAEEALSALTLLSFADRLYVTKDDAATLSAVGGQISLAPFLLTAVSPEDAVKRAGYPPRE